MTTKPQLTTLALNVTLAWPLLVYCSPANAKDAKDEPKPVSCATPEPSQFGIPALDEIDRVNVEFAKQNCLLYLNTDLSSEKTRARIRDWLKHVYDTNGEMIGGLFKSADGTPSQAIVDDFNEALAISVEDTADGSHLLNLDDGLNSDMDDHWSLIFKNTGKRFNLPIDDPLCAELNGNAGNCSKTFKNIATAFNKYNLGYNRLVVDDVSRQLDALSLSWDRFIDEARQQTIFDVWATTVLQGDHFKKDHLVGPPPVQYFLLHPGVVYEHLGDAPDGEQDQAALAMEWVGVNFWNWKVPVGFSITSVYSDRSTDSDTDLGGMIYLYNAYSIGWVNRDSGTSYYVSMDLLKAVTDKKQQLEAYKNRF